MPVHDDLGTRMKTYYEQIPKTKLMRRTPVAIRIDGKAFHTFTKGFQKPFDEILIKTMQETTKYLCKNIQGCVLGYTQSDEITLILVDYQRLETSAWFDYEVQKMCSIAASMATMAFNKAFEENIDTFFLNEVVNRLADVSNETKYQLYQTYLKAIEKGAMFDARVFNIPKEEVTNLIYWRQLDAQRNSVQMVGQANFSHKELQGKSCNMIKDMLISEKGIDWTELPIHQQRGSCVIKRGYIDATPDSTDSKSVITSWIIDTKIPIFKEEGREYIDRLI